MNCNGNTNIIQIGSTMGNLSVGATPFRGYAAGRMEMVFLASELLVMGVVAGEINSLAFDISIVGSNPQSNGFHFNNFTIKIGLCFKMYGECN